MSEPRIWRWMALAVSLVVHGLLFVQEGGMRAVQATAEQRAPSFASVRLAWQPAPEPPTQSDPPARPRKAKPRPVPRPRPKAEVKRKIQPAKAPKAAPAPPPPARAAQASRSAIDPGVIEAARQRWLASVLRCIEAHKRYPRAARRRRIEGEVALRFVIAPDGVRLVRATGGHPLLRRAARQAVERAAQTMPKPPAGVGLPVHCGCRMRFRLRED
ncbi:MAG: TonB family protein [Mariprofundaceae bacterium]